MTPHTLYGYEGSGSAAVEAALVLAGLPHRVVRAASWDAASALEELARANPLKQIPTLVLPDGTALSESAAILAHLGLAHPASGLLPEAASARALALRALVFIASNCYAAISILDFPERWTTAGDEASRDAIRAGSRAWLHAHWEVFADLHAGRPFLFGDAPGAADLLAAVVSRWSGARKHLAAQRPDFHALLQRVDTHPRLAPVFERHWPSKAA